MTSQWDPLQQLEAIWISWRQKDGDYNHFTTLQLRKNPYPYRMFKYKASSQ
jgi:hypothetical protein